MVRELLREPTMFQFGLCGTDLNSVMERDAQMHSGFRSDGGKMSFCWWERSCSVVRAFGVPNPKH